MRYYCAGALLLNLCAEYVVLYTVHADDELPVANELLNTLFAAQCCIVDACGSRLDVSRTTQTNLVSSPHNTRYVSRIGGDGGAYQVRSRNLLLCFRIIRPYQSRIHACRNDRFLQVLWSIYEKCNYGKKTARGADKNKRTISDIPLTILYAPTLYKRTI